MYKSTPSHNSSLSFVSCLRRLEAFLNLEAALEVEQVPVIGHVLATGDAEYAHALVVIETREELGRDKEVLARMFVARNLDHAPVHHALVSGVHSLVDLVDDAEGGLRHGLQCHEEEDS